VEAHNACTTKEGVVAVSKLRQIKSKPFATAAQKLRGHGLAVLPVDDKEPRIKFRNWSSPPGEGAIEKLISSFGSMNIGIVCHLSGVTVVDIDDPKLVEAMLERFGNTPLRTRTPSGGLHLWYRHNGEHNRNLRSPEKLEVDIKGKKGIIVVPPSIRPDGQHAGKAYEFISGSWDDLPNLPLILPGAFDYGTLIPLHAVESGQRNNMLFSCLLKEVRRCDGVEDLIDVARTINDDYPEPLSDNEVLKTAKSAWDIHARGDNWSGNEAKFSITRSIYDVLKCDSDMLNLYTCLQFNHGARKEPFAVSPRAMHKHNVIPGWGVDRYRNARNKLTALGGINYSHRGGKGNGDPHMFTLGIPNSP
jgi:hypothetical protein